MRVQRVTTRSYAFWEGSGRRLWLVPEAEHSAALGRAPEEFERRVVSFFRAIHSSR